MPSNNFCKVLVTRTLHFFNYVFFIVLVLNPLIGNASTFTSKVISQNSQTIQIKFSFEEPKLIENDGERYAFYKNANYAFNNDGAKIPVINKLFNLVGYNPQLRIVSHKQKKKIVDNYFIHKPNGIDVLNSATVNYVGKYRELNIFSVAIIPVIYESELNTLNWTEEIIVEIKTSPISSSKNNIYRVEKSEELFLKKFLLNANNSLFSSPKENAINNISTSDQFIFKNFPVIFKIIVEETGLYKVTYDELAEAGFPVSGVNSQNLALFNKGKETPLFINGVENGSLGQNAYLEFWGEKNEKTFLDLYPDVYSDPFSDKNVYWLVEKNSSGLRLVEESGSIVETNADNYEIPFRYEETLHFEKDTERELKGNDDAEGNSPEFLNHPSYKFDHWYWGNIITAVGGKSFEFHLPYPYESGNTVYVNAMFRGASIKDRQTNNYDGHQVEVFIDVPAAVSTDNLQKVGEIVPIPGDPFETNWIGQKMANISNYGNPTGLSQRKLIHGTNELQVQMDQEGFLDAVLLNWFDVTYDRMYKADKDFIKFKLQDGFINRDKLIQFEVDGFSTPEVEIYKLGLSKIVNGKIKNINNDFPDPRDWDPNPYRVTFQDQIYDANVEYVAVTENSKKKVLAIEEYQSWKEDDPIATILNKSNKADLIIVTNKLFSEEIGRLADLKRQAGYTVEIVNVSQIYDIFNFGIKSPLAIKEFLKYAYNNWDSSKKLKFVMLVGDASFDPKERTAKSSDLVPVLMYTTSSYGASPADLQYALISGDDLIPDISIGRIPATSTEELINYIDKIEEYQLNPVVSQWRNKALFISGRDVGAADREDGTSKPVFRAQNTRLIRLKLPQDKFAYKLNTQENNALPGNDPEFGGNRELMEYFDDGVTFINFFGHGGGGVWSDEFILELSDVDGLTNKGEYPFISSMTCFTGAFENPKTEGLAEKILMSKDKGAIAVLSSSSVGWKYNDFAIKS